MGSNGYMAKEQNKPILLSVGYSAGEFRKLRDSGINILDSRPTSQFSKKHIIPAEFENYLVDEWFVNLILIL